MNLRECICVIIKPDGNIYYVKRNNKYGNHYLYLNDISRQDQYLKEKSYNLKFERDDNTNFIVFLKRLISDNCIVFENLDIYDKEKSNTIELYLPDEISSSQKEFLLTTHFEEINSFRLRFLSSYDSETEDFYSLCENMDELKDINILIDYVNNHTVKQK